MRFARMPSEQAPSPLVAVSGSAATFVCAGVEITSLNSWAFVANHGVSSLLKASTGTIGAAGGNATYMLEQCMPQIPEPFDGIWSPVSESHSADDESQAGGPHSNAQHQQLSQHEKMITGSVVETSNSSPLLLEPFSLSPSLSRHLINTVASLAHSEGLFARVLDKRLQNLQSMISAFNKQLQRG